MEDTSSEDPPNTTYAKHSREEAPKRMLGDTDLPIIDKQRLRNNEI
jgi:hypothetical protein